MLRTYKPNRQKAPLLIEILRLPELNGSIGSIASDYGCHRWTGPPWRAGCLQYIPVLFPAE